MPTVSIIMPCKNERRNLQISIDSVVQQTFSDWELIVVDDGSTDGSQEYVRERAEKDNRIRLVNNWLNHGVANALNTGIVCSCGIYVARLDADDESMPQRIQMMAEYLNAHPLVGVVGCGVLKRYWQRGIIVKEEIFTYQNSDESLRNALGKLVAIGANCMIRREIFEMVGGYSVCVGAEEELEFLIRAAAEKQLGYVEAPLYVYNLISEKARSLSGKRFRKKMVMAKLNCKAIKELRLPKFLYVYPFLWLLYPLVPSSLRNIARKYYYTIN